MSAIPVVDLSVFLSDEDADARKSVAEQFAHSMRLHGRAAIVGHGLSDDDIQEIFTITRRFFRLSDEEKAKAKHPDTIIPHRGYLGASSGLSVAQSKSASEKAVLKANLDFKETYDVGHEENEIQKNIWLPDGVFPEFRESVVAIFHQLNKLSLAILEGLMSGMDLSEADRETLRQIHTPIEHQMRLAHYVPVTTENRRDPRNTRLAPHTDFASYTLLIQETAGGLEFQNRDTGDYMPATPQRGVIYLNIGDIMERYSNGFYPSAMHRVAIPSAEDPSATTPSRYSIPYFTHIALDQTIYPMPSRIRADGESRYEPVESQVLMGRKFKSAVGKTKA